MLDHTTDNPRRPARTLVPAAACHIPDALVHPVDEHPPPCGRHRPPPLGLLRLRAHRTTPVDADFLTWARTRTDDTTTAPRPPHP
ncbi:hypothetical protein [Streptomyces noursei]|uniref:hypothetical protein n=1 Tax=Streptomyces noursei TaxID=1971 RepID=UPI0023B7F349|nr:hypothetical protein [Streptomyces noursei]